MSDTFSLVIDNQPSSQCFPISKERQLIEIAQDCTDERKRNWAYRQLFNQESCQKVFKSLISQYVKYPDIRDDEDAWSAIREGFTLAVQRYRSDSEAQLSSVVYFYARDLLQRLVAKEHHHQVSIAKLMQEDPGCTHDPEITDPFQVQMIQHLLPQIKPQQQEVIALRTQTHLSWGEIGEQIGKSAAAAFEQFKRAISKLRKLFFAENSLVSEPMPITSMGEGVVQPCHDAIAQLQQIFFESKASESTFEVNPQPQEENSMEAIKPQPNRLQRAVSLVKRHSLKLWYLTGVTTALWLDDHPAAQACAGWLCGPKEKLKANGIFKEAQATILLEGVFLFLQFFALVIIALPILSAVNSGARREDYGGYIMTSVAVFMALTFINFLAGFLFGSGGTPTPPTTTAALIVPFLIV
jgi:hypothetical protein